jgi:RHS repeat-associated protein
MYKKIIIIAILLLNSVIAYAQIKKETQDKTNTNISNKIVVPGDCFSGYGYLDNDGDGIGTGLLTCLDNVLDESLVYVTTNGDCDDNNSNVTQAKFWYLDADADGFGGTSTSTILCYPPSSSYISIGGDCNDSNPLINPNTIWYRDLDNDGHGNSSVFVNQCLQPTGYVLNNSDCNDANSAVLSSIIWYKDTDGDGYGNPSITITQCTQPAGFVSNNIDCNDSDSLLNILKTFYADTDSDGFGDPNNSIQSCSQPSGFVVNNQDGCPTVSGNLQGCVVPNASTTFGDRNYIITTTPKVPVSDTQNILQSKDVVVNITYYDELGRPNQSIANKQSSSGKDIITHIEYDLYGRQPLEYLPFASTSTNMAFDVNAQSSTLAYADYGGQPPFSKKQFELSPLNRILKQAAPGTEWEIGSGHEIKFEYLTNTTTDAVKLYEVNTSWNSTNEIYDIVFTQSGTTTYPANQLIKSVTKDENWTGGKNNTTEEYKNKEGKIVLKRTFSDYYNTSNVLIGSQVSHDTYYVYDQYGNLTYVVPPLVTDVNAQLDGLCYQYKYDHRNRLVEKKLPGKQWEYIVYDKLDRVVATGPANSPFGTVGSVGWIHTKYDAFNRAILTAWQAQSGTFSTTIRKNLQATYNNATNVNETKTTTTSIINTVSFKYTNVTNPTTGYDILTINYYDDYDFSFPVTIPSSVESQTVYFNNTVKPKGLATGSWVRILDASTSVRFETMVTFYDRNARPIRTHKTNHLNGYTIIDSNLQPITGRTNYTVTNHRKQNSSTLISIKDEFTYSDQDKLIKHTQQLNNTLPKQLIASNTYNELGELTSKYIGGTNTSGTAGLQRVHFSYNIRGWLTDINQIANLSQGTDPQDLFAFKINYTTVQNQTGYTGASLYNGNISETYWRCATDNKIRKYGYKYDHLNRLKDAIYMLPNTTVLGNFNESMTYDKNGNILTLDRTGKDENIPLTPIDKLTYNYEVNTNKLIKVDDATNMQDGFENLANLPIEYEYDANGNMLKDQNKKITNNIVYNHFNLPIKITFASSNSITYLYNALGQKLEKKITSSSVVTTDYLDGFQYTGMNLDYFPHAEGYVAYKGSGYRYVFQYKDHLGNVRLSYTDSNNDGTIASTEILDENHYYPFGLKHKRSYPTSTNTSFAEGNKYKYNGKELQDELGLNIYDYGARNYDPALGRWMNIDPLAETSRRFSPYTYALNNPVYFIDPDGMQATDGIYINENGDKIGEDSKGASDGRVYVVNGSAEKKVIESTKQGKTIETSELNENKVFELASNEDRQSQKDRIYQKSSGVDDREFSQINMKVEGIDGTVASINEGEKVVKGDEKASVEPEIGSTLAKTMRENNTTNVTVTSMTHTHNVDFAKINNDSSMVGGGTPSTADRDAAKNNPSIKTSVINTRNNEVHVLNSNGRYSTISTSVYFKKH